MTLILRWLGRIVLALVLLLAFGLGLSNHQLLAMHFLHWQSWSLPVFVWWLLFWLLGVLSSFFFRRRKRTPS